MDLERHLEDALRVIGSLRDHTERIRLIAERIEETISSGGKVMICGNGGSAADAQHLAAELIGRYKSERNPLPAISLSSDPSVMTCIGNDYGFEEVFARQVEGIGRKGDLLLLFSTSGNSPNIIKALERAKGIGIGTIALLGKGGGMAKGMADIELIVDSDDTARVQEAHCVVLHLISEYFERKRG
jgi:D-sedoheptulose 7-phosphate isomerase